jgi:uncharacterized protein (DUF4415 family)
MPKGLSTGGLVSEQRASNPLGIVLRFVNKNESEKFATELSTLDDRIATANTEIKNLRKTLKTETNPKKITTIKNQIDTLKQGTKGGSVYQTRVIFARALNEGKLNRTFARLGRKPLTSEESELLAEQILHGDLDNALADVVEASSNFAVGNDYVRSAIDFNRKNTGYKVECLCVFNPYFIIRIVTVTLFQCQFVYSRRLHLVTLYR